MGRGIDSPTVTFKKGWWKMIDFGKMRCKNDSVALKQEKLRINAVVLWYSLRNGNGIAVDRYGNEIYIDDSCFEGWNKYDDEDAPHPIDEYGHNVISLRFNPEIEDCLCGYKVRVEK